MGLDVFRRETDDGVRDHVGVYGVLGRSEGVVEHINGERAGRLRLDAVSVGAYWTRYWAQGAYLDGIAQFTWYESKAYPARLPEMDTDGRGIALSLEGAYPFRFGARDEWVIEPQGQLSWQTLDRTAANDVAADITFEDADSLALRLGLRLARTWQSAENEAATSTTLWVRGNVSHEFMDPPTTSFSSDDGPVRFTADLGRWWAEANIGATKQMTPDAALLFSLGYQWGIDDDANAWTGKFGARFNW